MSLINTANISAGISFTAVETNSLSRITDIGSVLSDISLTQGTGNSECDCVFHAIRTASGNGSDTLDLTSLSFTLFDQIGTLSFHNVKGIVFKNNSESTGDVLAVVATGTNPFKSPFNSSSGNIPIYPTASVLFNNPIVGWTVDSTHKTISVTNSGSSGLLYEVCIVGVTG